jgi:hypothetical protein
MDRGSEKQSSKAPLGLSPLQLWQETRSTRVQRWNDSHAFHSRVLRKEAMRRVQYPRGGSSVVNSYDLPLTAQRAREAGVESVMSMHPRVRVAVGPAAATRQYSAVSFRAADVSHYVVLRSGNRVSSSPFSETPRACGRKDAEVTKPIARFGIGPGGYMCACSMWYRIFIFHSIAKACI